MPKSLTKRKDLEDLPSMKKLEKLNKITDQVMSLPPDARALLAHKLWDSLGDFADPNIERLWLEEAEKRWQEIEEGKVECIPAETVMMKAMNNLKNTK
jgi:putative addiction module component (TIGR02574 family)